MAPVKEKRDYLVGTLVWGCVVLTGVVGWYGLSCLFRFLLVMADWYLG